MLNKTCCVCGVIKPISEFKKTDKWYSNTCKICKKLKDKNYQESFKIKYPEKIKERKESRKYVYNREGHLKRNFNLTTEDYNNLLKKQNNVCAICKKEEVSLRNSFLSVDHCHKTNKIRGLLCVKCNSGIEAFKDNPELIKKAIEYLEKNG